MIERGVVAERVISPISLLRELIVRCERISPFRLALAHPIIDLMLDVKEIIGGTKEIIKSSNKYLIYQIFGM